MPNLLMQCIYGSVSRRRLFRFSHVMLMGPCNLCAITPARVEHWYVRMCECHGHRHHFSVTFVCKSSCVARLIGSSSVTDRMPAHIATPIHTNTPGFHVCWPMNQIRLTIFLPLPPPQRTAHDHSLTVLTVFVCARRAMGRGDAADAQHLHLPPALPAQ